MTRMDSVDRAAKAAQTAPKIGTGAFVAIGNRRGRVDMVVTSGKVPGVDGDIEGTRTSPAVRVVLWTEGTDGWQPTRERMGAKMDKVQRTAPMKRSSGKKDTAAELVTLLADHDRQMEAKGADAPPRVSGVAVKEVYDRGTKSWPGVDVTTLSAEEWAVQRVKAFLTVASGGQVKYYRRDNDLLPAGHPAGETVESGTVDPDPTGEENPVDAGAETAAETAAGQLATLDPAAVKATLAALTVD